MRFSPSLFWVTAIFISSIHGEIVDVKWFDKNPLFITGGNKLVVDPGTTLHFRCWRKNEYHFENVWLVDSEGYENCDATNGKLIRKCIVPEESPHNEEFEGLVKAMQLGRIYHFISTCNGYASSMNSRQGGHCETENLKLTVYVQ